MKRKEKPRPTIGMRIRAWWARWKDWLFKEKKTPPGIGERITNIAVNNFRGILGFFVPLCALGWRVGKGPLTTVENCWIFMIWFFFFQPVPVPVVGLWPIIYLPLFGALSTDETVKCYFNENIILFVIASMLLLLLNNSGFDRRLALWFLCSGDACQFSGKRMVFKCSLAAFVLSMFCSRLIVTSTLTQYVTPIYLNLRSSLGNSDKVPDYDVIRCVINNAIQTSSAIGSIAILHSAYCTLAFKAIWCESAAKGKEYPDIFNYLQWSAYAFPLAFVMWLFAVSYHMMLINFFGRRPMNAAAMNDVRNALLKTKQSIPKKSTTHERLSVVFALLALLIFFLRWNNYMEEKGWAAYRQPPKKDTGGGKDTGDDGDNQEEEPSAILRDKDGILHPARPALRIIERYIMEEAPVIKDATVAAIFVMALHVLPRTFGFLHLFDAEKRSQLKDIKPESAILWWRFVDKNTNYGYFFLIGSGVALNLAVKESLLADNIGNYIGMELINKHNWNTALFLICLYSCILTNMMTGVAALVVLMPLVLNAGQYTTTSPWQGKIYLGGLGVAVGTSLGFMWPFMYTPAYFCHHVGKVPLKRMALYSFPLVIICMLLLWFSLCYWAPFLWDPLDRGVYPIESPITVSLASTTAAPTGPPPSGDGDGNPDASG